MLYLILLFLLFLWKFSDIHKGWLLFIGTISIMAEAGYSIGILKLAILIGLAKVCIDLYDA